jgi:molybdenum cofactor synthesis domain-containing protein
MEEQKHIHSAAHGAPGGEIRVGILTCSDRGARGERADVSGPTIHNLVVDRLGATVAQYKVVPDERGAIESTLVEWVDQERLDLIFTTGGTGFAPRDVTPEATRAVVDREAPALVQAMLFESLRVTPYAMLTRATAGIRKRTLIINLPGNPKAVTENLDAIGEVLPHAVDIVRGVETHGRHAGHGAHGQAHGAPAGHEAHGERGPGGEPAAGAPPGQHTEHRGAAAGGADGGAGARPGAASVAGGAAAGGPPRPGGGIARNVGGPPC